MTELETTDPHAATRAAADYWGIPIVCSDCRRYFASVDLRDRHRGREHWSEFLFELEVTA